MVVGGAVAEGHGHTSDGEKHQQSVAGHSSSTMVDKKLRIPLLLTGLLAMVQAQYQDVSAFGFPCHSADPHANRCLTLAANRLAADYKRNYPRLRNGQEAPIIIDEISIELGGGPEGYRANFRDIAARGLVNLTVTAVNADLNRLRFRLNFFIPKIWARAKYRSSGTLLMIKASGGGDYWGEYEGVRAAMVFTADRETRGDREFLRVRDVDMDFLVENIQMGIENLENSNPVIGAAMNLFINANSKELLHEMKPALRQKLAVLLRRFVESQFADVPLDQWVAGLQRAVPPQGEWQPPQQWQAAPVKPTPAEGDTQWTPPDQHEQQEQSHRD